MNNQSETIQDEDCGYLTKLSDIYIICDFTHRAMTIEECPRIKSKCVYLSKENAKSKSM